MIRTATEQDFDTVQVLWAEYLRDAHKDGSEVLPTPRNLRVYMRLFDAYMTGELDGGALIAEVDEEPVGILLGGEMTRGQALDLDQGRVATMCGLYVRESHRGTGLPMELAKAGAKLAKGLGFETMATTIPVTNAASLRAAEKVGLVVRNVLASLRLTGGE